MLTFGWAFSFLDRFEEAQHGLRAPHWEPAISGNTQCLAGALKTRQGNVTTCRQTAVYGQQTCYWPWDQARGVPANPFSSSLLRLEAPVL